MPSMMTIRQIAKTGVLPQSALRRLVSQNAIPYIKIGNRVMINYDLLIDYLSKGGVEK